MIKLPLELVQRLTPFYAGRRVCVTGGAGFIGGHLVDALLALQAKVTVIDDLSNSDGAYLGELVEFDPARLTFIHGSILDDASMRDAVRACDIVFHLAAMGSVPMSIEQPQRSFSVNATGTVRVLEHARAANLRRVVYSASSSAYGEGPAGADAAARVETQPPMPLSPYAAGKLAGEYAMAAWSRSFGLSTVSLRYFNVFGPRQPADSAYAAVIAAFAKALLAGKPPVIFGDGRQSRDFTPVASAVAANLLAGASSKELSGQVVNIGAGRRTDLLELARLIAARCGQAPLNPEFRPARPGDVRHSLAEISAARSLLGYEPVGTLESALDTTIAWYREQLATAQ